MNEYDVIVVGVGTMGAPTCYELAKRGKRVLGLDQFDIPNTRASHHGSSRMIRLAYFEHPDYVTLLRRAFELWEKIEQDSQQALVHMCGGLYMGPPDSELVSGSLAAAQQHDLSHEMLDHRDLSRRYARFHLPEDYIGFFETRAGFVLPQRAISAYVDQALRHGAEIHDNEPVTDWQSDGNTVTVRTPRGEYRAAQAVFCGGAWMPQLLRDAQVQLTVTRQVLVWAQPKKPELFQLGRFPCWAIDQHPREQYAGLHYGFPMMPDDPGFKIGQHYPGEETDPDGIDSRLLAEDEAMYRPMLGRFIPDADGPLVSRRVCLYTNSADGHFIVDHHPRHANVVIACGLSGHGFKFAPVMGEVLADLAIDGASALPVSFLGWDRFSQA